MHDRWTRRDFARTIGAAALAAAGGAPLAASAANEDAVAKLYAGAKQEGKVVWWTAHYAEDAAERVRTAFKKKYPGVEVDFIRQTAQVIFQRATQDLKAGVREVDVFASTDEAHYPILKKQGALASFVPPDLGALTHEFAASDPDHTYQTGAIGFVVINYNKSKVKTPPRKWTEFSDAKWKGAITTGHPAFSGYVGNWVVAMNDKYGWDFFTKLAANNPKINRSVNDTVADILAGERTVGAGPDNLSLEKRKAGNPIDIVFPDDDAIAIISPVGIMKDAPHPNAARLFENFMYTKEYSEAMAETGNFPLRADVPTPSGIPLSKVRFYRNKSDRLTAAIPEVVARWRETFNV